MKDKGCREPAVERLAETRRRYQEMLDAKKRKGEEETMAARHGTRNAQCFLCAMSPTHPCQEHAGGVEG